MKGPVHWRMLVFVAILFGLYGPDAVAQSLPVSGQAHQQNSLRVLDPQRWGSQQGTIEEAVVSMRPKGIYMEYGLYLTFSARSASFTSGTPLEVEFFFTLPEEAILTDSWLWIDDKIIKAEIMDTWTASNIYEDIVNRQRDPSILFKRGQGQYELRVYPMDAEESRRVKITYLLPTVWTPQQVQATLPNHLLASSRHPLDELVVMTWPEGEWQNPLLVGREPTAFRAGQDEAGKMFKWARLSDGFTDGTLTLAYPSPLQEGMYLSYEPGAAGEGWYQLALRSFDAAEIGQNVLFLIDYDATKTNLSGQSVLRAVRDLLYARFSAADTFNVMLSRLNIERAADHWLVADKATVESTFGGLESQIGNYSNLPALLNEGLEFMGEQGSGGSIFLISSSDQVGNAETANSLLNDIKASSASLPPIHVLDLADRNHTSHRIGGRYFEGNEYFYINLTQFTSGSYADVRDGLSFNEGMESVYEDLNRRVGTMDLHTTLNEGFCYGRYTLGSEYNGTVAADELVLQVGKYYGDFPFVAELSGLVDEEPLSRRVVRSFEEASEADSTLATLWTGLHIQELEQESQTNEVISEIVDYSLSERVLSLYTAFLALEVEQGGEVCGTCRDETEEVPSGSEADEPLNADVQLEVYPSPFSDQVTIVLVLTAPVEASEVSFEIYDVMGRRVRTLQPSQGGPSRRFELTWDGRDDAGSSMAAGTYLLVVTTPEGRYTRGLTLVR